MTSGTSSFIGDKEGFKGLKLLLGSVWPQKGLDDLYAKVLSLQCVQNISNAILKKDRKPEKG